MPRHGEGGTPRHRDRMYEFGWWETGHLNRERFMKPVQRKNLRRDASRPARYRRPKATVPPRRRRRPRPPAPQPPSAAHRAALRRPVRPTAQRIYEAELFSDLE